jgi:hypothetical protein
MKSKLAFVGMVALLFAVVLTGCTTTDMRTGASGSHNFATITVKDYEVLGVVTQNAKETLTVGFLGFTEDRKGNRVTYGQLMEEALKLYPGTSDIINVRIDYYNKGQSNKVLDPIIGYTKTVEYYGSAVAIRYTEAASSSSNVQDRLPAQGISANATPNPFNAAFESFISTIERLKK